MRDGYLEHLLELGERDRARKPTQIADERGASSRQRARRRAQSDYVRAEPDGSGGVWARLPRRPRRRRRRTSTTGVDARAARRAARDADARAGRISTCTRSSSAARSSARRDGRGRAAARLGRGRGAGVRDARRRGHPRAPDRPGHRARHVQPAPRRAARRRDRRALHAARSTSPTSQAPVEIFNSPLSRGGRARLRVRLQPRLPRRRWCCGKRSSATSSTPRR